ncbi:hypothetical protein [Parvimonas sp. G1425]|uniref:hypothetical protein n=1 Tax=Parvimonas sp. G1425 TaxID=3387694 RepID=UPI0039E2474D
MKNNEFKAENSGDNRGIIVGQNSGTINLSMQSVCKLSSLIANLVKEFGEMCNEMDYNVNEDNLQEYKLDIKLDYNSVVKYKEIIKEFSAYYSICEDCLNVYDNSNIGSKAKILKCIHLWYLEEKGEILSKKKQTGEIDIDVVKHNSDEIINKVMIKIRKVVEESPEFGNLYREDIEIGIVCFTCFCFMECKILERPI